MDFISNKTSNLKTTPVVSTDINILLSRQMGTRRLAKTVISKETSQELSNELHTLIVMELRNEIYFI